MNGVIRLEKSTNVLEWKLGKDMKMQWGVTKNGMKILEIDTRILRNTREICAKNIKNVGRICMKILKIDTRILRNTREISAKTIKNVGRTCVKILEIDMKILRNIEVIDVMNLRSDIRNDVEKLGSTVRTLGIDEKDSQDIKDPEGETTDRGEVIK
jgi:predicted transport protein